MKLYPSLPFLLVLVANLGCSQGKVLQSEPPAVVPPPVVSPLSALLGEYRLLEVDGEAAEDGRLSVIEAEDGVGVAYAATLSGVASQRQVPLLRYHW